jgi:hypothetical protein
MRSLFCKQFGGTICVCGQVPFGIVFFCVNTPGLINTRLYRSSNFEPRVFIDGDKHVDASEEVLNKWYARRTEEALSGKRVILQCLPQLLGDMFVEEGVPVVYSLTDNDDMIASSAAHYRGDVLSADRDYFRYSPAAQFAVFSDFLVVNEQHATARLKLIPHPNPRPRPTAETRLLKAPSECLTSARYPSIFTSVQARVYLRGCGAPDIGTFYLSVFYWFLGSSDESS